MKTAYPSTHTTCSIRLYSNIPFDNTYQHHTLISSLFTYNNSQVYNTASQLKACERFIDRKNWSATGQPYYYPRYDITGDFNFNFQNGLVGNVTLELTAPQTNANYMRLTCGSDVYYYFITSIQQVNADTYSLSLELDVLMTYGDEFLSGMKDVPVFTDRKHCHRYTNDGLYLHCADLKRGESAFSNIKPSIIENIEDLHFMCEDNERLEEIKWLYICHDIKFDNVTFNFPINYNFKGIPHPLAMLCFPICDTTIKITDGTNTITFTRDRMVSVINNLISDGKTKGSKLSPYPPFSYALISDISLVNNEYVITFPANTIVSDGGGNYNWTNNKTELFVYSNMFSDNSIFILNEKNGDYDFRSLELDNINTTSPTPLLARYSDPKLLFSPFKKYKLSSVYSDGNEFFPELIYSELVYKSDKLWFGGVYTSFIGDYNIFTYVKPVVGLYYKTQFAGYKENNIGLSSMVNYSIPTGTNALDVFNSTQAQSFYTSKVASGISSGLSIAGGIASIVVGSGMVATTGAHAGSLTPMGAGLVSGGATAIASGVAGISTSIKSGNAKIEDLKNTPDEINVQGGSFVSDYARYEVLPFMVVYSCAEVIKKQADDYFYNYGYEVARECYFNSELKYNNDLNDIVDNNLFGRDIFNYIKINEDITNKIDANIPHVVKEKLSQIFNKGITLWSWFGFSELWGATSSEPTSQYYINNWFMKCRLDNSEVDFVLNP